MREIKFRAWDKATNEWCAVDMAYDDAKQGPISKPVVFDGRGKCVIMQYTGLRDKNGAEIYEGDIITVYYTRRDDKPALNPSLVRWNSEYGGWEVVTPGKHGLEVPLNQFWITGNTFERVTDESIGDVTNQLARTEVIGNIYENPELLKG